MMKGSAPFQPSNTGGSIYRVEVTSNFQGTGVDVWGGKNFDALSDPLFKVKGECIMLLSYHSKNANY